MFDKTAEYYDLIYSGKDYAAEAVALTSIISAENPGAKSILDAACGTGEHDKHLARTFHVDGIDLQPESLEIARRKNPSGTYTIADMSNFALGKTYDAVLCLFSSIGYLTESEKVVAALTCFKNHLAPGGVILIEPWFTPEQWIEGALHMQTVDLPDVKICRMNLSELEGKLSKVHFHYLIGTPDGVRHFEEDHNLTLYTRDEMLGFFKAAGLSVEFRQSDQVRRGMYVARHPG
jgi:SAM-dependent methyltransferase